jgi:hypothetical protein
MIITEIFQEDSLTLKYATSRKIYGLGGKGAIESIHSYENTLETNGVISHNANVFVLNQNQFALSQRLGVKVNGIISLYLFKKFFIELNFEDKMMILHDKTKMDREKITRGYQSLPLKLTSRKLFTNAVLKKADKDTVHLKLLVDTGINQSLWLDMQSDEKITPPDNQYHYPLGTGLSGQITGFIGRVRYLNLGGYKLRNPYIAYPDSSSISLAQRVEHRNGSLGCEMLRRFSVFIDYGPAELHLRPNKYFGSDFTFNFSGIEVEAPFPGLPYYQISRVVEESPADHSGLQVGDVVQSINWNRTVHMTLDELYEALQVKCGRKLRIKVQRDSLQMKFKFRIEDCM